MTTTTSTTSTASTATAAARVFGLALIADVNDLRVVIQLEERERTLKTGNNLRADANFLSEAAHQSLRARG